MLRSEVEHAASGLDLAWMSCTGSTIQQFASEDLLNHEGRDLLPDFGIRDDCVVADD
jgi:hypothetical protein